MTPPAKKQTYLGSFLLVVGLLGLILTSIFLSRRSLHDVQKASTSIYEDRLVPSGILLDLTATVYRKRLLLETYVLSTHKPNRSLAASAIDRLNRRSDSLLTEFEATKLTMKEADQLRRLKQRLTIYNQLESELTINLIKTSLVGRGNTAFGNVAQTLDELAALQLTVGKELVNESLGQTNYIYVLTALQIGLVLVIGLSLFWHRF